MFEREHRHSLQWHRSQSEEAAEKDLVLLLVLLLLFHLLRLLLLLQRALFGTAFNQGGGRCGPRRGFDSLVEGLASLELAQHADRLALEEVFVRYEHILPLFPKLRLTCQLRGGGQVSGRLGKLGGASGNTLISRMVTAA